MQYFADTLKNKKIKFFSLFLVFSVVFFSPASASAIIFADITGENGYTIRTQYAGASNGLLYDNGKSYEILEQQPSLYDITAFPDINTRHRPLEQMRHQEAYSGSRSIIFQGYNIPDSQCPKAQGCPPDRQELRLAPISGSSALNFDEWRFLRFYMKVHPDTTVGSQRAIISQTWQIGSTKTSTRDALGPAFAIMMSNYDDTRVKIDFTYRNNPDPDNNPATTFLSTIINKNQWYSFHVQMKPKYDGSRGVILVWKNKSSNNLVASEALNYSSTDESSWKFHWGYKPESSSVTNGLRDAFDIRVGMYRPPIMQNTTFWMDNIKLTDSASSL